MGISEEVSLPNSQLEEESQVSSSSPPLDVDRVESDHCAVILETLDREFKNLLLEEERKFENHEGERIEKVENFNQEKVEVEEVDESVNRDGWGVEENVKSDGWVVDENGHGEGWGVDSNGNQDGWGVESIGNQEGWTVEENGKQGGQTGEGKERSKKTAYPSRPGEPDCAFYLKTGTCGFGSNCKFNHPPKKKHKVKSLSNGSEESVQVIEEKAENPKRVGRLECKYYLTPGGCKFGKACRYHHPREKTVVEPPSEFNFLGLPIRPGERECPFYMRTGSCKFASNCRFNHPDPTAGATDPGYDPNNSLSLHPSSDSQSPLPHWSPPPPPPSSDNTVSYMDSSRQYIPIMPQSQPMHLGLDHWSRYQVPVNPLYSPDHPQMVSPMNGTSKNIDGYSHHMQQMPVDEYPERPGQKECQYYMTTGDCKYKSQCRFHHPKARFQKSPSLSPLGLPLRPDQIACTYFSRYGICKYGRACKYDHTPTMPGGPFAFGPSYGGGFQDGNKAMIQQTL